MYHTKDEVYNILKNNSNANQYFVEKWCCSYSDINLAPMFDIQEGEYLKPIEKLKDYYTFVPYYDKLYSKHNNLKLRDAMLSLKNFNEDLDNILLQYCKCRPNMAIILSTSTFRVDKTDLNIIAIKDIRVTFKQLLGLIYQFNVYLSGVDQNYTELLDTVKTLFGKEKVIVLHVLFVEKYMISYYDKNVIYETSNFTEVIEVASIVCTRNTFQVFEYQRLDRILKGDYVHSRNMLMTYKKWLYTNISLVDQIRFMVFSGTVLYTLGVRNLTDLDVITISKGNKETTDYDNKLDNIFIKADTKFPFIDFHNLEDDNKWYYQGVYTDYLSEWFDKDWPKMYGSESMIDTVFNPNFTYYYLGVKVQCVDADIKRRLKRNRPAAYADIYAVQYFTRHIFSIPPLDKGYWKAHVYYEFTPDEIKKLENTMLFYLKKKFNINATIVDVRKFLGTQIS